MDRAVRSAAQLTVTGSALRLDSYDDRAYRDSAPDLPRGDPAGAVPGTLKRLDHHYRRQHILGMLEGLLRVAERPGHFQGFGIRIFAVLFRGAREPLDHHQRASDFAPLGVMIGKSRGQQLAEERKRGR